MRVEREIQIEASPREVYDTVMDPSRLKDWVTIHQSLEDSPDGQLRKGSKLTQCLKLAGRRFRVHWTVVENDSSNHVVWEGRGPVRSRAKVIYDFEENGGGTRFSYANEYNLPGGFLGRAAGPVVRRMTGRELDSSLDKLKKLVE
jgi:carbon monoxide dehydrogenase subunit G